jgi:hypothetical protein
MEIYPVADLASSAIDLTAFFSKQKSVNPATDLSARGISANFYMVQRCRLLGIGPLPISSQSKNR